MGNSGIPKGSNPKFMESKNVVNKSFYVFTDEKSPYSWVYLLFAIRGASGQGPCAVSILATKARRTTYSYELSNINGY